MGGSVSRSVGRFSGKSVGGWVGRQAGMCVKSDLPRCHFRVCG